MLRIVCVLALAATAAACQTRQADPVQLSQPGDAALACGDIARLQAENRGAAAKLAKLDEGVQAGNAIAIAISQAWFWPAVFAVDMSDVEEIEARALMDRNRRLAEIAEARGCVEAAAAPAPTAPVS